MDLLGLSVVFIFGSFVGFLGSLACVYLFYHR